MKWKLLRIEMFAVVASYLVISISVASAVVVRTYDPMEVEFGAPVSFSPRSLVKRDLSVDPGTGTLSLVLSNGSSSVVVEGAWLYRCRDRNPYSCMESVLVGMDAFPGDVDTSYAWSEISSGDMANLLCFVKLNSKGSPVWMAFWTAIERNGQDFTVKESDISEIGIYARDSGLLTVIREFIKGRSMIPANPEWISRIAFKSASSIYEISMDGEEDISSQPNSAGYQEISGSEVSSVSGSYGFMLPVVSSQVKSPVTLYLNPSYTCGMFGCESSKGETSSNCCLDCPCSPGWYCDSYWGCRSVDGIGLGLFGTVSPRVEDCFKRHIVSIPVKIENAPTGHSVTQSWCKLGGVFGSCVCNKSTTDVYVCSVEVPPVEDCDSGEFRITNNAIRFKVDYMDGETPRIKYVETSFPDVTIGSFVCGSGGCESDLGEDWENCCYDCGCPDGYCDYRAGDNPSSGVCMEDPGSGDIAKTGKYWPDHLYTHNAGDQVSMNIVISNKPKTFRLDDVSCELGCIYDYSEPCSSSCSISCTEEASSDPGKYNMTCTLTFTVSGYDSLRNYDLTPELTLDVYYRNGTLEDVYKSISTSLNYFSIGPHWCGDKDCGVDENYAACCYDCLCPAGQYCDTRDIEGPSEGDRCRDDFGIVIDSVGSLDLVDSSQKHKIPVLMHVEDYPDATDMDDFAFECYLAGGDVECELECERVASVNPDVDYNLSCMMTVPALDYVSSPYYDEAEREIRLAGNSLNVSLYYNNGFNRELKEWTESIRGIVIEVTSHCGEGSGDPFVMCETWLGEDQTSCCRDCGCSDFGESYFCYLGASPNGECVDNSTIGLRILGFETEPWECMMGRIGGECKYIKRHVVNAHIVNSPDDLEILDVFCQIDGKKAPEVKCIETATYGNWDCAFIPDSLEGDVKEDVNRTFKLSMSVNYTLNGMAMVKNISAFNGTVETSKKKTSGLESCEARISNTNETINRLRMNQKNYDDWGWIYYLMGAIHIAMGIACLSVPKPPTGICIMMIATGLLMIFLGGMGKQEGVDMNAHIEYFEDLKSREEEICSSPGFEEAELALTGLTAAPPVS